MNVVSESGPVAAGTRLIAANRVTAPERGRLTKACERVLRRMIVQRSDRDDPAPLPRVPQRLLAVKVHGMGDAVMVRSLLEQLRARHPQMEIGVLVGAATRDVMSLGSDFRVHDYEQKRAGVREILRSAIQIRRCAYEAVLNFEQGSLAGTAFLRALGVPAYIGFVPLHDGAKAAFLTLPLRFRENDSMWTSLIRAVRLVDSDFPESPEVFPLPVSPEAKHFVRMWLEEKGLEGKEGRGGIRRVVFHMGCGPGQPFRRWPVERFVALAEQLQMEVPDLALILTGTAHEKPLIATFLSQCAAPAIDASGLGSIERTASLLAESDLLFSNDTGVMHLGAAMGVPTVGIFGPDSTGRYAPVGPHTAAVAASGVPCSPCSNIYRLQVPGTCANPDTIRCLRDVTVEAVIAAARGIAIGSWLGGARANP
ncbi:MAG TPA: glycosyltransferase family 9 protein [Acetobacteraceae bacterium]|nr:glycosyltransferase family 9 protein [Acetobacteraceae bacterium]